MFFKKSKSPTAATTRLDIQGMHCQHCVEAVNLALSEVPGVARVTRVELDSGLAEVEGTARPAALAKAVRKLDYKARVVDRG